MIQTNVICPGDADPSARAPRTPIEIEAGRSLHRILNHLEDRQRSFPSIIRALDLPDRLSWRERKALKRKLAILIAKGLVVKAEREFAITAAGLADLRRLGPIFGEGIPTIRVFPRTAAV